MRVRSETTLGLRVCLVIIFFVLFVFRIVHLHCYNNICICIIIESLVMYNLCVF